MTDSERYDRACTIMWGALGSDKADLQNDVFTLAAAEIERLRDALSAAHAKLSCVAIERQVRGVPEIVRVCDQQAMGIIQESLAVKP